MKAITLLFITLLLLATLSQAARPIPKEANSVKEVGVAAIPEIKAEEETNEVYCEGVSEKECLMRRTLVAHTDYIYTQGDPHKH
ncbi:phytosulfokines isoform X1 [Iris pallida]|uniref:Phytosulfokine n=1 Tax=Iris pallida TaxID=29817 RepID=A0AAX6DZ20_IRIPA|nr:phytosulfokines isoform X1 [Iris pallida]